MMKFFADTSNFNEEMLAVQTILEHKGFLVEADHSYAYSMQYSAAFEEVSDWLAEHGYDGTLKTLGHFDPSAGAVYCLYDEDRISLERMHQELKKEAKRQSKLR